MASKSAEAVGSRTRQQPRRSVKIAVMVLGLLAVLSVPLSIFMFYGMGEIKNLVIRQVELSKLRDGVYRGSYHKARWTYDVEVAVRDHRMTSIKNLNPRMDTAADLNAKLEAMMLERQRTDIDVVSGATIHSKAFQKAVETALTSRQP
jgi:uncharacterized protein with FMN-binding domain